MDRANLLRWMVRRRSVLRAVGFPDHQHSAGITQSAKLLPALLCPQSTEDFSAVLRGSDPGPGGRAPDASGAGAAAAGTGRHRANLAVDLHPQYRNGIGLPLDCRSARAFLDADDRRAVLHSVAVGRENLFDPRDDANLSGVDGPRAGPSILVAEVR